MEKTVLATLCFPFREGEVLLGMKKRGFGAGWWNGFGGKVREGENLEHSVVRELKEESGLTAQAKDLTEVARMRFYLPDGTVILGHTYLLSIWEGSPQESEEMRPQWFALDTVPYQQMWPGDERWLPEVFSGRSITGEIRFGATTSEVISVRIEDANF